MRKALLLALIGLAPAAPALADADDVALPEGWYTRVSTTCTASEGPSALRSDDGEWPLDAGERLVRPTPAETSWQLACGGSSVGTKCFPEGYVVAGFEGETMALGCYEGEIPAELKD